MSATAQEGPELLQTGSRAPYVHRITLYDHEGTVIDPDKSNEPYSPRATCAKCHDYATISHGWHFNAACAATGANPTPQGRPGEPWFLVDPKTKELKLLSARGWPGTVTPAQAGLSDWAFMLRFGRHLPGGGFGEPAPEAVAASKQERRWAISGPIEIDCMICHSAAAGHDMNEWARQIERENFKWAPTAALGLALVRGSAKDLPDDWDPLMPSDPNRPPVEPPRVIWSKARFDADDRVLFDIVQTPSAERCYYCHSVREVGPGAPERWFGSEDVHLQAGLTCADCHTNGIDHLMIRGYETEAAEHGDPSRAAFSCTGCHLGTQTADHEPALALGGRFRAPHPQHRGLPPVHFDKLTCTACHSGPWPQTDAKQFQTALAHGLGLATRDRHPDDAPTIIAPVFGRQHDGKIAPQRLLFTSQAPQAENLRSAYRWPLAHDVRPAAQSLGVRGCTDCHAADAPIYFGRLALASRHESHPVLRMHQLRGESPGLLNAWALGYRFRPFFKWFAFAAAAFVLLALFGAALVPAAAAAPGSVPRRRLAWLEAALSAVLVLGVAGGAVTGLGANWFGGGVSGWALLGHMITAPMLVLGLAGVALLNGASHRFRPAGEQRAASCPTTGRCLLFWLLMLAGLLTMLTMLAAMLPVFGYAGQAMLIEVHEYSAIVFVVIAAVYGLTALRPARARR